MTIVLEKHGYKVVAQYTEDGVVDRLVAEKPDLVILDVMFPQNVSAGFDIAREIKGDKRVAEIPIIMLSAINEKGVYSGTFSNEDKDKAWLPVEDFIEKPIKPAELVKKIESVLQKPK